MIEQEETKELEKIQRRTKILSEIEKKIPPLPHVIRNIINLTMYEEVSVQKLAEEIAKEPNLVADIMRYINSRTFSTIRVSSLETAIVFLGVYNIARLTLAFWIKRLQETELKGYIYKKAELALQSFIGGYTSKRIAEISFPHLSQNAFAVASMRNIGKIILDFYVFLEKKEMLRSVLSGKDMREAEEEILGISHQEVNYLIAEAWNLPDDIKIPIRYFKSPHLLPNDTPDYIKNLTFIVHVGDIIAQMTGVGAGFDNMVEKFSKKSFDVLKIKESDIEMIFYETFLKVETISEEFFKEIPLNL